MERRSVQLAPCGKKKSPSSNRLSDPIMLRPTHCETAYVGPHWLLIQLHVAYSPRHFHPTNNNQQSSTMYDVRCTQTM